MDLKYDRKFEEMKKYIPFLENMIKRLESTSMTSANPRQAQLDKIRSLRDLLLDKKKRMKMENLLKCEQVLVNLYAKVEQRDTQLSPKSETSQNSKSKDSSDLEAVRNKLKSVVRTTIEEGEETLPEIARASIIEETCTPGSKEPALFQRRPNKTSKSPARITQKSPIKTANSTTSKRNYTRVLLSPEPSERRWDDDNKTSEKLFSRRSPRRSPKRCSPTYNKKERKKSSKQSQGKKSKDLNITLSVPEESLNSLNSKDILKRIMNCSDNDVDIKTLREAKRQILNELKQTGAKYDDISDLLLKSYEKTGSDFKKKDDVEEGELSDSESEAIQSIYGNFILDDNDNASKDKNSKTLEKPKKIQICLVINQDKDNATCEIQNAVSGDTDNDFEMFDKKSLENVQECSKSSEKSNVHNVNQKESSKVDEKGDDDLKVQPCLSLAKDGVSESVAIKFGDSEKIANASAETTNQVANFYKPLVEETCDSNPVTSSTSIEIKENTISPSSTDNLPALAVNLKDIEKEKNNVEIPLLHDQSVATQKPKEDVVSEIDILQALKNEILSESLSIPGSESTPLMHQPKLTKVASVQEIVPKKRISIEKYKKKSIPSTATPNPLFVNDPVLSLMDDSTSSKEDSAKKQSLKLTEKECERFNFPTKLAFDDDDDDMENDLISDEDTTKDIPLNDTYGNLAPKSPDHIDSLECVKSVPPVIIPVDPVKTALAPSKSDVDMRTLMPNVMVCSTIETNQDLIKNNVEKTKAPVDPRVRRDLSQASDKDHLVHSITLDTEKISQPVPPVVNYPNMIPNVTSNKTQNRTLLMTPNMNPNMTPSRVSNMTPNMTPNRNINMTPNARSFDIGNRQKFEVDDNTVTKHVYAPTFPFYDHRESREQSVAKEQERRPLWDQQSRWGDSVDNRDRNPKRDPRSSSVHRETSDYSKSRYGESFNKYDNYNSRFNDRRDSYSKTDCPRTPLPSFGRPEAPSTPNHPFGRLDAPMTPVPSFGRTDCPSTPSHPFGRSECPSTPSHSFGRTDLTWNECPMTPSHPFGRMDVPTTPSHPFGRMDVPTTPSHPFGRSESHSRDPRLNRTSEYDNFQKDDADRNYRRDRNRLHYHNPHRSEPHQPDSYRNYREHSLSRNERNNYSENDSRHFNRDQAYKRESSIGCATSRDYDDRLSTVDRNGDISRNEYHHKVDNDPMRKGFIREQSAGRSMSIDRRMHHASSRASSVGRTVHVNDTRTSVKPDTGSSFTINTSVRSTFQDFLRDDKSQMSDSFERRKRASSVGRTLHHESNVGRSLFNTDDSKHNNDECLKSNNFRRARSVGRDILSSEKEKTFKDLRADFEKFYRENIKGDKYFDSKDSRKYDKDNASSELKNQSIIKNKNIYENANKECRSKKPYSPRKNQRDPRMRRNLPNSKNKYVNNEERGKRQIGIVYSNDNIKKGTILGPGLGVKNYKIPKIKRAVEEVKEDKKKSDEKEAEVKKDVKKEEKKIEAKKNDKKELKEINRNGDKVTEKDDFNKKNNNRNKTLTLEKIETKQDSEKVIANPVKSNEGNEEKLEKRITRLTKKSESSLSTEKDIVSKTKKSKRPVLFDSDSEEDKVESIAKVCKHNKPSKLSTVETSQANETMTDTRTSKNSVSGSIEIPNNEGTSNEILTDNLESNFAIDDLEIFSDNLASDPVIDNINAIIADLDNDLDSSKIATTEFSSDITLENMLDTFDSDKEKNAKTLTENLNDISEVINNDLHQSVESKKVVTFTSVSTDKQNFVGHTLNVTKSERLASQAFESGDIGKHSLQCEQPVKDDTVSTTEINKETIVENVEESKMTISEANSVPDSTNEANSQKLDSGDSLPDSTNESQIDLNSLVTSSHDTLEISSIENVGPSSVTKEVSSMNSIGNILSILQNKSKLKEILNLLGDQSSENEKIKKKLEKLSEIVLDEDDEVENNPNEKSTPDVSVKSLNQSNDPKDSITEETSKVDIDSMNDSNELSVNVDLKSTDDVNLKQSNENETNILENNISESTTENVINERNTTNNEKIQPSKKLPAKKGALSKKGKGKAAKNTVLKRPKRITRSANINVKKTSRELLKLQEDLKEMFISDDVLNATGIRMCRLAKLVNDNTSKQKEDLTTNESGPVVVLEKFKDLETVDEVKSLAKNRKKPGPKRKPKTEEIHENKNNKVKSFKYKPGPKSKTKHIQKSEDDDPYAFESDSVSENNYSIKSADGKEPHNSDSESDSISSSQSFGSTDLLVEVKKKPKRKRSAWQSGVIKPKNRKKKFESNQKAEIFLNEDVLVPEKTQNIPDNNCFTDKSYCFFKNIFIYSCRLCVYSGENIVNHYKQQHPHSEIPLSRLSPEMAKEAIEQCEEVNFQSISKIPTDKYVCRFCFKEFTRKKAALEAFFWHIVSMHTGEYKHSCTLCDNDAKCPFNLDIPPPPKEVKGQLIGYICEKCNFTQISLENLKTHVIVRHNDEQTEVYTINLAVMSKKAIKALVKCSNTEPEKPRVLRSSRSNQSVTETSDDHSDDVTDSDQSSELLSTNKNSKPPTVEQHEKVNMQSKITFESDDNAIEASPSSNMLKTVVKKETIDEEIGNNKEIEGFKNNLISEICGVDMVSNENEVAENSVPEDIDDCAHFKITYTDSGLKEYVCCINGIDNHYKTTLLISMKKHVQVKHAEIWDGYCFICKVIVTPQGKHTFKDCFQHYLDKHMDNFPVLEKNAAQTEEIQDSSPSEVQSSSNKSYINVRPMSELMSKEICMPSTLLPLPPTEELPTLPKIENVMSLGAQTAEPSQASPSYPSVLTEPPKDDDKQYKYEEVQAEVMSKKHRVVLDTMMSSLKLVNVFKCAGSYCSFSSDSPEQALLHASTHQRVGGENSLICSYCDFDCSGNAIDLVMHVFKAHGTCPYACGYCFYRATASQLVMAHISRIHKDAPPKILSLANVQPPQIKDSSMLSREVVVLYYVCAHVCKFRAYTAGRFCEHLIQQHAAELSHPCYICKEKQLTPQQLIQHMKCHELNVYQCTWCLHGADTETALLYHSSQKHPHKQPQAYLRVITNKDGSSQLRVLPLVSFNKSKVAVDIVPANMHENPVREAERSIDLEKLIGHTNMLINSVASKPNEAAPQPPTETESAVTSIIEDNLADVAQQAAAAVIDPVSVSTPQRPATPVTTREMSEQVTRKIKSEPPEQTPKKTLPTDVVVCLDSDDENSRDSRDSRLSIIALSDDETSAADSPNKKSKDESKYKIIPWSILLTCPVCLLTYKSVAGFKRHTNTCVPTGSWTCAHCEIPVTNRDALVKHYVKDHMKDKCLNVCDLCNARFPTVALAKTHLKYVHGITKTMVWKVENAEKEVEWVVGPVNAKPGGVQKRKRSSSGATEPPSKLKRFGPRDVDLLPINPILDESVSCSLCEFKTKVRLNMVRHLQLHAEQQPVPQTAPINPVPHLETNEKHFDKMVNLASSSIVNRAPEKQSRPEGNTTVSVLIPPEAASRYPRYVPDRQRHTCGAKGCSYISVDEAMLRCHWETLHSGSNDFHCVHCPPYQHLDTSKPLTAARIIAHLKMHDATLYACSSCAYYHYKKQVLDKHLSEVHKGVGRLMVVREEVIPPPNAGQVAAPTMDLKPWQCGICNFKSMLRPEVVEHCSKSHQTKMQFKCYYCPFRTSTVENVTKHQANIHPKKNPEIFYFYYREGSIPDEVDGTPRWVKQRQKFAPTDPEVKSEVADSNTYLSQLLSMSAKPIQPPILDLNIVKKEVEDSAEMTIEQLLNKYGQTCEPNGLRYKCPLCKVVTEDTKEAIQSHLYEELKYRRWACTVCSYKAFHRNGLSDHIVQEHRGFDSQEPTQLPLDVNIEKWVTHILQYQTKSIEKNKDNLSKQKILTERPAPSTSTAKTTSVSDKVSDKYSMKDLEQAFGKLGVPSNMFFCCPKCDFEVKEESSMRDHLEGELTKIRWCCSSCAENFQTYHEAQFHCKSVHGVGNSRPVEAVREPAMRAAWIQAVLRVQRLTMNCLPANPPQSTTNPPPPPRDSDNSLLVVRYEETVTPSELVPRKRPAESPSPSEVVEPKRKAAGGSCPSCPFKTKYNHVLREHLLRHYDLKPFSCTFCDFNGTKNLVMLHLQSNHECVIKPEYVKQTPLPTGPLSSPNSTPKQNKLNKPAEESDGKMWCLICERILRESDAATHAHDDGTKPEIGKKGDVVVKCCVCMALRLDYSSLLEHHNASHPDQSINYAFFKLFHDTREVLACSRCDKRFKYIKDLKSHHNASHDSNSMLIYNIVPYSVSASIDSDEDAEPKKSDERKRVARKSTTKLPAQAVAKKSTTRLPYDVTDVDGEYSFYGTKPLSPDRYENVTTLMSFYNTMVPFTLKKLCEVIDINPTVVVEDFKKKM
ncbi:unnamed protein product [Diatraea saccharalis]|uniref:C2H2-type domain-containing protein n=1 Tax=Diatraea saccharalis TaxID=40085 RepID=A0A9N9WHN0_9NEOP|nr:unnamed protein product [Diatraea saccharalis]